MRTLFLLLLFANVVFFAWSRGYFGTVSDGREPQRLAQQLNPGKLKVVFSARNDGAASVEDCRSVGGLHAVDGQKLLALLGGQLAEARVSLVRPQTAETWDIVIAPLTSRAAVDTKIAELKKLGLKEPRTVETKSGQFSLLLGSDASKAGADQQLLNLTKTGVKSARIVQRIQPDEVSVQVRGPVAALARLPDLVRSFSNASMTDCPAN